MIATPEQTTDRPGRGLAPPPDRRPARVCEWEDLGRLDYDRAWETQRAWVARVKSGADRDRLLFVEHPHTITLGRNARSENLLATPERLAEEGFAVRECDRGGDVTYHGPGQLVGYPILNLAEWKRDVAAYMRALEEVLIRTLADFGLSAEREPGATGAWVGDAKVAAMGIHISRWVSSHGFALNLTTDLSRFERIIPCGLTRPVASVERLLGQAPSRDEAIGAIVRRFGEVFGREMQPAAESN